MKRFLRGTRCPTVRSAVPYLVRVLDLPLSRLTTELEFEVSRVEGQRPDVVKGGDRLDLALDIHELRELRLVVADGRVGSDKPLVLHVLVFLPEPVVLAEPRQILEYLEGRKSRRS